MGKIHYGKCEKCNYMGGLNDSLVCMDCLDEKRLLSKKAKFQLKQKDKAIEILREGLEFYSDKDSWSEYTFGYYENSSEIKNSDLYDKGGNEYCREVFVGGKTARETLKQANEILKDK